jgi:hypothetical protein
MVVETSARLAECQLLAGDVPMALSKANETLEGARALGGVFAQIPLLHRIRGAALARLGDLGAASQAMEQSLVAARARRDDYEVALTLRTMVDVALGTGGSPLPDLLTESQTILDRLGVQSVTSLLSEPRVVETAGSRSG